MPNFFESIRIAIQLFVKGIRYNPLLTIRVTVAILLLTPIAILISIVEIVVSPRFIRVIKANVNSLIGQAKDVISDRLEVPVMNGSFGQKDVQEILLDAMTSKSQYLELLYFLKYAGGRKVFREDRFSEQQLSEMAADLGILPELLQFALQKWQVRRSRRKQLRPHFVAYVAFNTFLILLNLTITGTISWAVYPLLTWGLGLLLLTWNTYQAEDQEYEEALHLWRKVQRSQNEPQPNLSTNYDTSRNQIRQEGNATKEKQTGTVRDADKRDDLVSRRFIAHPDEPLRVETYQESDARGISARPTTGRT